MLFINFMRLFVFVFLVDSRPPLQCPECKRSFELAMHLGVHLKKSLGCRQYVEVKKQTRQRPTISKKCEVLGELLRLEKQGVPLAQTVVCAMFPGIGKKNISMWRQNRFKLFAALSQGIGSRRTIRNSTRVRFPSEEEKLYMNFVYRRQILGLKTTDIWLKLEMASLLSLYIPGDWYKFKCSNGWVIGFKKRYRVYIGENRKHQELSSLVAFRPTAFIPTALSGVWSVSCRSYIPHGPDSVTVCIR